MASSKQVEEWDHVLPFERKAAEAHARLAAAKKDSEREACLKIFEDCVAEMAQSLSAWERVQLARHALRPRAMSYIDTLFDDFIELHGDRLQGDDSAMPGGIAQIDGRTVIVVGQEKGVTTEERVQRNFGMAHPAGYRKAMRLFRMAERMKLPVITFVDTPAAHPGIEAEEHGQGPAIAESLLAMSNLQTPIMTIVIGEGGSGGALGIAVADYIAMLEHAIYVICPPERCAEILWRDVEKKAIAASAMRVTAHDLKALGVIDEVLDEPGGGAHRNPNAAFQNVRTALGAFLEGCDAGQWGPAHRRKKFEVMGEWLEVDANA